MIATWTTIVVVMLVTLGVLAAPNLLRLFIRDGREGRKEESAPQERRRAAAIGRQPVHQRGLKRMRAAVFAFAPAAIVGVAHAQNTETTAQPAAPGAGRPTAPAQTPQPGADTQQEEPTKSAISLQLSLDYTTAYFYHGIIQEDTGLILQPAAKLTINLYEQDDFKIDALLGVWNSFHGQKTGANTRSDFTEYWYEADLIAGFVISKDKLSLTTTYTFLTSPSDAYETVQELDLTLAYDDSDLLGKFALHPYVLLGVETGADASDGADSDTGTYLELGIAPGFSFDLGRTPVSITFPASVGLSLEDYYQDASGEDETFGFAQVGVKASVPLPFGDRYGKWTLNAGVSALFLGDNTSDYNGGDDEQIIGTVGLQLNF